MILGKILADHWEAIASTGIGTILFNAIVDAMPAKDTKIKSAGDFFRVLYGFVFDSVHNFASFRSGVIPPQAHPIEPPRTAAN